MTADQWALIKWPVIMTDHHGQPRFRFNLLFIESLKIWRKRCAFPVLA
jgi:hypothetical protein